MNLDVQIHLFLYWSKIIASHYPPAFNRYFRALKDQLMHFRLVTLLILSSLFILSHQVTAQTSERAQPCFFTEDFETGLPSAWDLGPLVEMQTANGDSLGEFVPAWSVGATSQLNGSPYFPVPDQPSGNFFLMANDDIAPCNCTMADVMVTTPIIDLSGRTQITLECRVFNEMNLGAGNAMIEATTDGVLWDTLLVIPAVQNEWQDLHLGLGAYDGVAEFRLRFRWSDGGGWASGFAVDDICLRESFLHDLSVLAVHTNSISTSPFAIGDQSLRYSQMPLTQIAPMVVSAEVMNRGTMTEAVVATVEMFMDGTSVFSISPQPIGDLAPGERLTATIETSWVPPSTGLLEVRFNVQPIETDSDPSDNMGSAQLRVTGPGWDNGYSAMAADENDFSGDMGGEDQFIAAVRMEIPNTGGVISGISAALSGASVVGEEVRVILFDANLAFVDTSSRYALTQEDIDNAGNYGVLYLPLTNQIERAPGDYFVGLQHLVTGDPGTVRVRTSGTRPEGADLLMEGATFEVTYVAATPMVRMHFADFGVGVSEVSPIRSGTLFTYPVPMARHGVVTLSLSAPGRTSLQIMDPMGKVAVRLDLGVMPAGQNSISLDVSELSNGVYYLVADCGAEVFYGKVVVSN